MKTGSVVEAHLCTEMEEKEKEKLPKYAKGQIY